MCSLSIFDKRTASSINILSVTQNASMATLISLETTKLSDIFMSTVRHFCPISTKSQVSLQILHKTPNIKFQGSPSIARHADKC